MLDVMADALADALDEDLVLSLTEELVGFDSQLPNDGPLAEHVAARMRALGCFDDVVVQPVVPGRSNVIGVLRGSGGARTLMLNGHLDVGKVAGVWDRSPFDLVRRGDRLYGLGVSDMKGSVAAMIAAGAALGRSALPRRGDVLVAAVIHHDVCGLGTKFLLASWDGPIDAAIVGEPTDLCIQTAHGGAWQFRLRTMGEPGHPSRSGGTVSAIDSMMLLLSALKTDRLTYDRDRAFGGLPILTVGTISGGSAPSRMAEECIVEGDIRTVPGMDQTSLMEDIRRIIDELRSEIPSLEADVTPLACQRPFRGSGESDLARLVQQAHRTITGRDPHVTDGLPASAYVTDAADLSRAGITTVVYGPGDWRAGPEESVLATDLVAAARVYGLVAQRYSAE